jgi:hypothetical protein
VPKLKALFVDRVKRFSLEVDLETGRNYIGIPVRNSMVEYTEWYEVTDKDTFAKYQADPTLAHDMVGKAKRREIDNLLLLKPGSDRGEPD